MRDASGAPGMDAFVGRLDPEMYVVTAAAGGERAGCLVGFASQCSLDPLRFVVWLSRANRTFRVAGRADRLAVHTLTREQHALAALFGGRTGDDGVDKFAGLRRTARPDGAVVLDDAPAWFVGRVVGRADGGDHVGFVLDPVDSGGRDDRDDRDSRGGTPLLRLSDALDITPGHPAG
ncbi:flavin oxidoreductase [Streptomyces sp. SAT1]|uniref:flavin reductase family protein n=1 Tax=unclassified Streptomyces TaxID=2593676 RepID=UPI0007DDC376|nr:flavin reductase family protein [Streptomyces sp. SAT1]ANH94823.1 flavin oxidoreductase [Streptomyces sp. SAT1]